MGGASAHSVLSHLIIGALTVIVPRHRGTLGLSPNDAVPSAGAKRDKHQQVKGPGVCALRLTSGMRRRAAEQDHPLPLTDRHRASRSRFKVFKICWDKSKKKGLKHKVLRHHRTVPLLRKGICSTCTKRIQFSLFSRDAVLSSFICPVRQPLTIVQFIGHTSCIVSAQQPM